jgi:diguanylate cyclase (GGDEF)-like protein/PAS domain S-box-containing protein
MTDPCEIAPLKDRIETHVKDQAELLDAILSSITQGVLVIDADGLVVTTNPQFRLMHHLPDDLCAAGNHFLELARYAAAHGHYGAGDPEILAQEHWRAASAVGVQNRSLRLTLNGFSIEITGQSMPGGGFVNTYTDVTESSAREASLRETEAGFRLLADHSSDVICLVDPDGVRLFVSPAAERLLGWTAEQLRGTDGLDLVHPEDRSIFREAQLRVASGAPESSALFRHRRPDNSWLWVESRARRPLGAESDETERYIVVLRDATDRKHTEGLLQFALEQLEQIAITDGLTGLANRRHFDEVIEREWRRCSRQKLPLSVLMVDVDHFKLFNDRYGHLAGDECLQAIASQVAAVARRPGDLAARYGGEEFVLLMPEAAQEGALHVATRLCGLVQGLGILHAGNPIHGVVTISIGLASCAPDNLGSCDSVRTLLSAADVSLYRAKRDGRNGVAVADSSSSQV